ncbi:MAG TPA: molybdate ABC transporter substrate-binding protein [Candidatus Acidoferrum sp.]|nr:molybdate ABC transporter substrate-binding protein [Candidatus Acidoferrum sp.]
MFSSSVPSALSQTLRIAAASDLQFVLPDLAAQYEKQSGVKLAITYGSSGSFVAQIQNGAPFDLFLSADTGYPRKLVEAGHADTDSFDVYAWGFLAIWIPPDSEIDLKGQGYRALLDPRIRKIAIANPEHAPYGRAAVAALHDAGIYDQIKSKLVFGENVLQSAQFVQSGNADAAVIPRSLALSPRMRSGKRYELTDMRFTPVEQAAVIMKSSSNREAARSFLGFLRSASASEIWTKYGYVVTPKPPERLVR